MLRSHEYIHKIVQNGKTRYFYTKQELDAYRKALSSKDEMDALKKVTGTKNSDKAMNRGLSAVYNKRLAEKNARKALTTEPSFKPEELKNPNFKPEDKVKKEHRKYKVEAKKYSKQANAYEKYENARSLGGKAKAVKKIFNKYHPDTARKINKGKKKIDKLIKKKINKGGETNGL